MAVHATSKMSLRFILFQRDVSHLQSWPKYLAQGKEIY